MIYRSDKRYLGEFRSPIYMLDTNLWLLSSGESLYRALCNNIILSAHIIGIVSRMSEEKIEHSDFDFFYIITPINILLIDLHAQATLLNIYLINNNIIINKSQSKLNSLEQLRHDTPYKFIIQQANYTKPLRLDKITAVIDHLNEVDIYELAIRIRYLTIQLIEDKIITDRVNDQYFRNIALTSFFIGIYTCRPVEFECYHFYVVIIMAPH